PTDTGALHREHPLAYTRSHAPECHWFSFASLALKDRFGSDMNRQEAPSHAPDADVSSLSTADPLRLLVLASRVRIPENRGRLNTACRALIVLMTTCSV